MDGRYSYPVITFLSSKKSMAWINGRGPYTTASIYTNMKKNGTYETRIEFDENGKMIRRADGKRFDEMDGDE